MILEITTDEQEKDYKSLMVCMDIVTAWVEQTKQAGNALSEIQENKYYKHWYPSFNRFVAENYNMSYDQAQHLIRFSRVAKVLESKGEIKLLELVEKSSANISQHIPKKATDEQVVEIISKATKGGTVLPQQEEVRTAKDLILNKDKEIKLDEKIKKNNNILNIFLDDEIDYKDLYLKEKEAHKKTKVLKDKYYRSYLLGKEGAFMQKLGVDFEYFVNDYETMLTAHRKAMDPFEAAAHKLKINKEDLWNGKFIKQQYKKMAKLCHPDRGGTTEEFQSLRQAFDLLIKGVKNAK